jgi:hypothetical protein
MAIDSQGLATKLANLRFKLEEIKSKRLQAEGAMQTHQKALADAGFKDVDKAKAQAIKELGKVEQELAEVNQTARTLFDEAEAILRKAEGA